MKKYKFLFSILLAVCLFTSPTVFARGHSSHSRSSSGSSYRSGKHTSRYTQGVKRDKHGHIARSSKAKEAFMKQTGYPHGRPGYVIDHVVPLKRGGADTPSNMQWQTKEGAKLKDKTE